MDEFLLPRYVEPKLEGIDLSVFSLHEVYGFYGIEVSRAEQTMGLAMLEQSDARTLGITVDHSVLMFSSVAYDKNNRAIEFSRSYTRADKCNFTVNFKI